MQLFAVKVHRDDTVEVVAVDVVKETPSFYMLPRFEWDDPRHGVFGYSMRIEKANVLERKRYCSASMTPREALEKYMERRQRDKESARAVAAQATKQIASANELLMRLPSESAKSADAVDPSADSNTGTLSTRA